MWMRRAKRLGVGLGVATGVTLVGTAAWLWEPLPQNPPSAVLRELAAGFDAEILRDRWGVPHVHGARDADAAFGLAYAHAEDDFSTIQEVVAASRGILARHRGSAAATTDYIVRWMGIWEDLDARYATEVPDEVKALAQGYAAGLNLYASEHPEATWPGLAPFGAKDVLAGFMLKTPLFYGLDEQLLQLMHEDSSPPLALDLSTPGRAFSVGTRAQSLLGSNAFAVAPARSGDGVTRLVINSHQPLTGPVAWYEAHISSDDGLDIIGGIFPGTPVILHGFNRGLGWANTVNQPDLVDIYALESDPSDPARYRLDDEWRDLEQREIEIQVRLFGPFAFTARRTLQRAEHGPVIETARGLFAVRYAGMGEIRQLQQYYAINKATDLDAFLQAMSLNALPSINYVVADSSGDIAFVYNAQFPARASTSDMDPHLPGDRSELIWRGYRGWQAVPMLVNPQSGFVFNSNNTPFTATDGPDNLRPGDYPRSMGIQRNQTNRSLRVMELTDGRSVIDAETLLAIKFDKVYADGSILRRVVDDVLALDWTRDPDLDLAGAAAHLASWDFSTDARNRHAALGVATAMPILSALDRGRTAPSARDAFRSAARWLIRNHGTVDVEYGRVNRLAHGQLNLPIGGGPDTLRAVHARSLRDDGELHMGAGDSWIAVVEWAPDGTQRGRVIHSFGSATSDASSPHHTDQSPLFVREQWRDAVRDRTQLRAEAERIYRPGRAPATETGSPAAVD